MANIQSAGAGDITANHKPGGCIYSGAVQSSLVDSEETLVVLGYASTDFGDDIEDPDNNKITPGVEGIYAVIGRVTFMNCIAGKAYRVRLFFNGVYVLTSYGHAADAGYLSVIVTGLLKITEVQSVTLKATSYAGVDTVDLQGGSDQTFIALSRIR